MKEDNKKVIVTEENYRAVIIELVKKMQSKYLKRVYSLVFYLYMK